MQRSKTAAWGMCLLAFLVCGAPALAVVIDTVMVGNPGNAPDTRFGAPGYGAVNYSFQMGKFEVSAGDYTAFLNAVARTDTYGLYSTQMADTTGALGCNIRRIGTPGTYTYTVAADWASRPVNFVSWGDSARFANWLFNGQPTGLQGLTTTEDGSYFLNGAVTDATLLAVTRKPNATWVIPTDAEWYKAAYHKNDGATGNYWAYPTRTNEMPNNGHPSGDTGNSANFLGITSDYTIGSPYFRTPGGFFSLSASPYGTFDQGGNVMEWTEAVVFGPDRGERGGEFESNVFALRVSGSNGNLPTIEYNGNGFRIALVPEPAMISMLALLSASIVRRRKA